MRIPVVNLLTIFIALTALAVGCAPRPEAPDARRMTIAVSVSPHAWLVEQIGGASVRVVTLVPPGQSAEMFQPDPLAIQQAGRAAVYFRAGVPVESRGLRAILASDKLKVVDLRDGLKLREMAEHSHADEGEHAGEHDAEHEAGPTDKDPYCGKDPHTWLCPRLLKIQAAAVARTLAEVDPQHQVQYAANLAAVEASLDRADAEIRKTLQPHAGRGFIVFHPAWGYFAEEYGLHEIAVETEGKTPSDRELTELQRQAREEGSRVVFVPRASSRRSAEAVARAIGGEVDVLDDLAPDVPNNLRGVARTLADSFHKEKQ